VPSPRRSQRQAFRASPFHACASARRTRRRSIFRALGAGAQQVQRGPPGPYRNPPAALCALTLSINPAIAPPLSVRYNHCTAGVRHGAGPPAPTASGGHAARAPRATPLARETHLPDGHVHRRHPPLAALALHRRSPFIRYNHSTAGVRHRAVAPAPALAPLSLPPLVARDTRVRHGESGGSGMVPDPPPPRVTGYGSRGPGGRTAGGTGTRPHRDARPGVARCTWRRSARSPPHWWATPPRQGRKRGWRGRRSNGSRS
jgi:hypothetical protein